MTIGRPTDTPAPVLVTRLMRRTPLRPAARSVEVRDFELAAGVLQLELVIADGSSAFAAGAASRPGRVGHGDNRICAEQRSCAR